MTRTAIDGVAGDRCAIRRQAFNLVDHARRCSDIEAVRPDESLDEPAGAQTLGAVAIQHLRELPGVFVQSLRLEHEPAIDVLQVLEVQRAFLRGREFFRLHRVHRTADDA